MGFSSSICNLNALENLDKPQLQADHIVDTTLRLDSLGSESTCGSGTNRKKMKWSDADATGYPEDDFTLVLGWGCCSSSSECSKVSSTSALSMSSGKESEEGSTLDLSLDFQPRLGSVGTSNQFKQPTLARENKASETETICDLQLSLSTEPSTFTTVAPFSVNQSILDMPVSVNGVTPIDEGSTSSRRKPVISILPPFHSNQATHSFNIDWPNVGKTDSVSSMSNHLSATTQMGSTSAVTHMQHPRNTSTRTCQFQGCGKGARGASGLCIAHGGGRRCQKDGCQKGAEGRTPYCKAHGGGRRCQSLGCTKSAEGRTDFCIAHGGGRRCSHEEGCTRAARGKSDMCIRHGGGKRCQRENCTRSAEGYSGLCISHGGGRRCRFPSCTKGAQGSTMFCKAHGGGKRCTAPGCTKGAEGRTPFCKGHGGGKRCSFQGGGICPKSVHGGTQFCVAHGGGKRCAAPECTKSARGRTDFCVRHGGGKRCKSEGCGKSAQGRTDFCKAHGGGKKCSWGHAGSNLGFQGPPCERFARGNSGLCTTHNTLTQDRMVHGTAIPVGSDTRQNILPIGPENLKGPDAGNSPPSVKNIGWNIDMQQVRPLQSSVVALPEGRVHGGSLMAMLANVNDLEAKARFLPGTPLLL